MLDDAYLWTTNDDAEASILDGDNEVVESTGALICSECQVKNRELPCFGLLCAPFRSFSSSRLLSCSVKV